MTSNILHHTLVQEIMTHSILLLIDKMWVINVLRSTVFIGQLNTYVLPRSVQC